MGEIVQAVLIARVIAKNAEFQEEINAAIHALQAEGYLVTVQYAANDTFYSALVVAREQKEGVNTVVPEGTKFMLEVVKV